MKRTVHFSVLASSMLSAVIAATALVGLGPTSDIRVRVGAFHLGLRTEGGPSGSGSMDAAITKSSRMLRYRI